MSFRDELRAIPVPVQFLGLGLFDTSKHKPFRVLNVHRFNRLLELLDLDTGIVFIWQSPFSVYDTKVGDLCYMGPKEVALGLAA